MCLLKYGIPLVHVNIENSEPAVEVENLVEKASAEEENKSDQWDEARENGMEIFLDGPQDLACWLLPTTINNHIFDMLVDSGAYQNTYRYNIF